MFGRLRRRRPEVATDTDAGATAFEDVPTRPAGYAQTASKMHAFNRYEIKYLVDELRVPELRAELARHMDTDPYSPHGGYPVTSVYYDTADLRFYWEKI